MREGLKTRTLGIRKTCITCWLLLCVQLAQSQEVRFYATSDAREIITGGYAQVSFVLENARGRSFRPPDFGDLNVLSGPATSNEVRIVNGRSSQKSRYTYTLSASKAGNYTIGSASVVANGKTWKSAPISIKAVKGRDATTLTDAESFFVRLEVSDSIAYIGQQITLQYALYSTVDIPSKSIVRESDYPGFYSQVVRDFANRLSRVIEDGVAYKRSVLRTVALFPQQTGPIEIEGATFVLGIPVKGGRSRGLFFSVPTRKHQVVTEGMRIDVREVPQPVPEHFSGAVGRYQMDANVNRLQLTTDDALTIVMRVRGNGDAKQTHIPMLPNTHNFEVYEPKLIDEQSIDDGGKVVSFKTFEYVLVPKQAGTFSLIPSFTYFDIDSLSYRRLTAGPFSIRVRPGTGKQRATIERSALETDIRPLHTQTTLHRQDHYFFASPSYWLVMTLPVLGFLGSVLYRRHLSRLGRLDVAEVKYRGARKIALKRLELAQKHMQAGHERAFYDEVSKATLGYVSDKLNLPGSDLTKEHVQASLRASNADPSTVDEFMDILSTCELALYARKPDGGMASVYASALRTISDIETTLSRTSDNG